MVISHHAHAYRQVSPLVLFWIGVITGALVVGLLFLYKTMGNDNYKTSVLLKPAVKTVTVPSTKKLDTTSLTEASIIPTDIRSLGGEPGTGGF